MKPAATAPALYKFRLYVAGDAVNSVQAIANLEALCQTHLPNRHLIEIVDVFQQPDRALNDRIFMTPTLLRLVPAPQRRVVGTLSNSAIVLHAMDMDAPRSNES